QIRGILNAEGTADYEFPPGAAIPAKGYVVVAGTDPSIFRSLHSVPLSVPVFGPFGGALDNGGERIRLLKPAFDVVGGLDFILVDQVRYNNKLPLPTDPDGGPSSLERKRAWEYGNEVANWEASLVTGGTPGALNSVAPPPGANQPPTAFFTAKPSVGPPPLSVALDAS